MTVEVDEDMTATFHGGAVTSFRLGCQLMLTGATFRVACMACGRGHDSFAAKEARKWILCKLTGEMKADTTPHDASPCIITCAQVLRFSGGA